MVVYVQPYGPVNWCSYFDVLINSHILVVLL